MKRRLFTKDDLPGIKKRNWRGNKTVKAYQLEDDLFLFPLYTKDTHLKSPDTLLRDFVDPNPVAFTRYRGRFDSSITTYVGRINRSELARRIMAMGKNPQIFSFPYSIQIGNLFETKEIPNSSAELGDIIDEIYSIQSVHIPLDGKLDKLINSIRHDIFTHTKGRIPKTKREISDHFIEVPELNFNAEFKSIKPSRPDLVVKYGKGLWAGDCSIDLGADGGIGCVAVLTPQGTYDTSGRCSMCYAHQNLLSPLRTQFDLSVEYVKQLFEDKIKEMKLDTLNRPIHIRLGQSTEMIIPKIIQAIPGFRDNLIIFLDAIIDLKKQYDIRSVMPSHTVEYDPVYSRKFRQADLSLIASIDDDNLDKGIVGLGFDTKKRLEGLERYSQDGVNCNIYVAVDFVRGVESFSKDAKTAIEFWRKHPRIGLQFLDIRITKKSDASRIGGDSWQRLKYQGSETPLLEEQTQDGGWKVTAQTYLAARHVHPSIKELIAESHGRMRGCYVHSDNPKENMCGNCFMEKITSKS